MRQTTEWVNREKEKEQIRQKEKENEFKIKRPSSCKPVIKKPIMSAELSERPSRPPTGLGMFENYYYDKLVEKNLLAEHCGQNFDEEYLEYQKKEDNAYKQIEREKQNQKVQNIEEQINQQYEAIKKAKLKEPLPDHNERGMIIPKTQKNYINENRQLVKNKKIIIKENNKEQENPFHKNYGKTPSYIEQMKVEAEIKKELDERKKKEARYPKGTRLLKEEERLKTLEGLQESKKELLGLLEKLPITMSSVSAQKRKAELERKLDEVEEAIETFSRKEVFIKVD